MLRLFIFLVFLASCTGVNSNHVMLRKYSEKINIDDNAQTSYLSMSKARYEEIYHGNTAKYHLESKTEEKEDESHNTEWDTLELIWPASGVLTSAFGVRTLRHRTQMHTGIDIGAQVGTPVYASETGRVVFSGTKKGYGQAIMLRHDKIHETLYGHLSRIVVQSNEIVHRNQLIGYVGKTGRVTGANLHFETRVNGVAKDPLGFLPGSFSGKHRVYVGKTISPPKTHRIATAQPKKDNKG